MCGVQFWASQYEKDMSVLQKAQQRTLEMMKGLENLTYEEKLGAGGEEV